MLRSLDTVVDPNVINIWSFMMNKSELAKSGQKPSRVTRKVFRYNGVDDKVDDVQITKELHESVLIVSYRQAKNVDMILIPAMLGNNHYILVSFNLKYPAVEILDDMSTDSTTIDEHKDVIEKLRRIVCKYLSQHNLHHKKKKISSIKPVLVQVPWANCNNPSSSGILCMGHMEAYMGAQFQIWETEMKPENHETCERWLRVIYLSRIIMSEFNEVREDVKKKMQDYKKTARTVKQLIVRGK